MRVNIDNYNWDTTRTLKSIVEQGDFFKTFAKFTSALDGEQARSFDNLLLENVRFGSTVAHKLGNKLRDVEALILKAQSAKEEMEGLIRLRASEPWRDLTTNNQNEDSMVETNETDPNETAANAEESTAQNAAEPASTEATQSEATEPEVPVEAPSEPEPKPAPTESE